MSEPEQSAKLRMLEQAIRIASVAYDPADRHPGQIRYDSNSYAVPQTWRASIGHLQGTELPDQIDALVSLAFTILGELAVREARVTNAIGHLHVALDSLDERGGDQLNPHEIIIYCTRCGLERERFEDACANGHPFGLGARSNREDQKSLLAYLAKQRGA